MQFRVISIPATGDETAEGELNRFLRSHRAVSVQRELVTTGAAAFWCFCIEYLAGSSEAAERGGERRRVDYKELLSEPDFQVFARLREVRKQLAAEEAVPVYAICTNEHLGEMAESRAATISDLKKIGGFGDAKAEKYGKAFLTAIQGFAAKQAKADDATDGQADRDDRGRQ